MKYEIFRNKNCFITGATGGIGRNIAMKMAENGCDLFLTATNDDNLKDLKKELESVLVKSVSILYKAGDLNNVSDINNIIAAARSNIDSVDILVNCAGTFSAQSLSSLTIKDYESCFNLNVRAVIMFCKEFSQDMIKNKWGRIINIGSSSAYSGYKETSLYCSSKHAVLGFSRALHDELKKYNIRTYCISPAGVKTRMGRLIKNQNFDTFIDPKELAEYVVFVSSFDNNMVSEELRLNRMFIE